MVSLEGRVAVITGAGRGLGRAHAILFAELGARVVVNDLGVDTSGGTEDQSVAEQVAAEIRALGGHAVANTDSVSDWYGARRLIDTAVETFGRLDVLVNNAGIVRDRMLVNMSETEFDSVIDVHLKGTFCPTRHAAKYWRDRSRAGEQFDAAVINTSSGSGLFNNIGQSNYGAAKSGIATFSQIVAKELARYGVRVNTIAPMARTRLSLQTPGLEVDAPSTPGEFDFWDPANVSPLVAYLAGSDSPITGAVFLVAGSQIKLIDGWNVAETLSSDGKWTVDELPGELERFLSRQQQGRLLSEPVDARALTSLSPTTERPPHAGSAATGKRKTR